MITLIAESKTMNIREKYVEPSLAIPHTPYFEKEAGSIMDYIRDMEPYEIAQRIGISSKLAVKAALYSYEFPNKSNGLFAIEAFTGDVFRSMDIPSFTPETIAFAQERLLIVSSLYGLLFPYDIIKTYRLDYKASCAPSGDALYSFWKPKLTERLIHHLLLREETEIINLLPGDAAKCIDWKKIRSIAHVITPRFIIDDNKITHKTPNSRIIKEMRGYMTNKILLGKLDSISEIESLNTSRISVLKPLSSSNIIDFIIKH